MFLGRPRPVLCFLAFLCLPFAFPDFRFYLGCPFPRPLPSFKGQACCCLCPCLQWWRGKPDDPPKHCHHQPRFLCGEDADAANTLFGADKTNWVGPTPKITARPHPFFSTAVCKTRSHQVSCKKMGGRGNSIRCGNNVGNRLATTSEKWFPLYAWNIAEAFAEALPLRKLLRKLLFQTPESRAKASGDGRFEASEKIQP